MRAVPQVVGLDMVDDESRPERRPAKHMQTPAEWNLKHNPAYSYYAYYVYANLYTLNKLREARGLNTIAFRPHAGMYGYIYVWLSCYVASFVAVSIEPLVSFVTYLACHGLTSCKI